MENMNKSFIIRNGNVIGLSEKIGTTLSQEAYDALSEEKKNDGTIYFIPDGDGEIGIQDTIISENSVWSSQKIATELKTSENVEPTELVFSGDTAYFDFGAGNNKYEVKNGVCYFQVYIRTNAQTTDTMSEIVRGLPKPKFMRNFNVAPYVWANNTYTPLWVCIDEGGTLQACKGGAWYSYFINGSYPIA